MGLAADRLCIRTGAWGLAVLLLGSVVARAQAPTLGEVARREEERRKATTKPARVMTNKDLPKVASPAPIVTPSGATPDKPEMPVADADKPDKTDKVEKDEAWWRARIVEARTMLLREEVLLDALQARVNSLTSEFAGRDDPYQRSRIGEDRQKALGEMERVRTEVAGLKTKIETIEEEARKASVPPGWLR